MDINHFDSAKTVEGPVVSAEVEPEKKRTTLAELFMEDDDMKHDKKKPKNPNFDVDGHEEVKYHKQNGSKLTSKFSFAKKMNISKSKDKEEEESRPIKKVHDSRPIKKVHQVTTLV